jgi:hypothetical protein
MAAFSNMVQQFPVIAVTQIPFNEASGTVYKELGIMQCGYYLVRPDLYIAYRCNDLKTDHFEKYLKTFLRQKE